METQSTLENSVTGGVLRPLAPTRGAATCTPNTYVSTEAVSIIGSDCLFVALKTQNDLNQKERPPWTSLHLVPLTGHFSNPFFANVDELLALRDSLEEEGLIARLTALPNIADKGPHTTIPYRP